MQPSGSARQVASWNPLDRLRIATFDLIAFINERSQLGGKSHASAAVFILLST